MLPGDLLLYEPFLASDLLHGLAYASQVFLVNQFSGHLATI